MSIFENYQTASFRNIVFILDEETTEDGRKTVSHEFVNSDRRFVEDLGRISIIFSIRGFVHGDGTSPGFRERDALKEALNKKGVGQLVHPVYGRVDVVADPYSVSSSMRNAGRFDFRMVFRTQSSDREPFVVPSRGVFADTINPDQQNLLVTPPVALSENPNFATESQLANLAQDARDVAAQSAEDIFVKATDQDYFDKISEIYQQGIDKIRDVTETIEDSTLRSLGLTDINRLFNDPPGFLSNPEILFPALSNLYRELSGAGAFNKWIEAGEDFIELFSLGTETKRSRDISNANGALISNYGVNALINCYQAAVTTDFNTVDELEEAEGNIEDLYQEIVNDPIDDSIIIPELRLLLQEIRSIATIIFNQKEQNVVNVVTFDSKRRSFLQTIYDLYGNLDNLTIIANLNQNINASTPRSPIQVIEEL